jgi:hypothetical protein
MPNGGPISICVRHAPLSRALTALLGAANWTVATIEDMGEAEANSVVVTTTADCTLAACGTAAARGVVVVVLATFPGAYQEASYLDAGAAAYVGMTANVRALAEVIESLAPQPLPPRSGIG